MTVSFSAPPPSHRVDHAASWKMIKNEFVGTFRSIIFPMMCYSSDDDQLWHDDPYEYIRMKFGERTMCSPQGYMYSKFQS